MRTLHWILFPALIAVLALAMGCPTSGDDDSADDDDDNPNAPVISNLDIGQFAVGEDCNVQVAWHVDDADGDLDGSAVKLVANDSTWSWTFDLTGTPPFNSADLDLTIKVGGVVGQPHFVADTEYDLELWMHDLANNESNHLTELGWMSPDENCF